MRIRALNIFILCNFLWSTQRMSSLFFFETAGVMRLQSIHAGGSYMRERAESLCVCCAGCVCRVDGELGGVTNTQHTGRMQCV